MNVDKMREALIRAERKLAAYVGVCKGDKELTDAVLPMVREALAQPEQRGEVVEFEVVALNADGMTRLDCLKPDWWFDLPTGRYKLYTALPSPTVPDDVIRYAARYNWLVSWLIRHGLLFRENCVPDRGIPLGDYISLWPPFSVNRRNAPVGFGKTAHEAIDAAILAAAPAMSGAGPDIPPSPTVPELLDDTSLRAVIGGIGNEVHNLSCEQQGDDKLASRLGEISGRLWDLAQQASPSPTVPDGYLTVSQAVAAWESEPGRKERMDAARQRFEQRTAPTEPEQPR